MAPEGKQFACMLCIAWLVSGILSRSVPSPSAGPGGSGLEGNGSAPMTSGIGNKQEYKELITGQGTSKIVESKESMEGVQGMGNYKTVARGSDDVVGNGANINSSKTAAGPTFKGSEKTVTDGDTGVRGSSKPELHEAGTDWRVSEGIKKTEVEIRGNITSPDKQVPPKVPNQPEPPKVPNQPEPPKVPNQPEPPKVPASDKNNDVDKEPYWDNEWGTGDLKDWPKTDDDDDIATKDKEPQNKEFETGPDTRVGNTNVHQDPITNPRYKEENQEPGTNDKKPLESEVYEYGEEESPSSGHFFGFFLTAVVICISGYVIYHNKQKIMAFCIEGRHGPQGRRRSNRVKYSQLKSNVEEVMPSLEKTTTAKNFVY